jgi:AMMECR1 domain-containing protein
VAWAELDLLDISIAILSPTETVRFDSEADLLRQLRPHVDGLILEEDGRHATFLPAVWESLPEPKEFLAALKEKGNWRRDYWSDRFTAYRYRTEEIP